MNPPYLPPGLLNPPSLPLGPVFILTGLVLAISSASFSNISGCLCTLGNNPIPTALLTAFATRR